MRLTQLPYAARGGTRVLQIASVLVKYGFGHFVTRIGLASALHDIGAWVFKRKDEEKYLELTWEERVRLILQELGPTFVKLGQIMATRPDLIPMSLITELRKLQDKVPPFDVSGIKAHVEAELKRPLSEIFSDFEDQPLAAASIAQVHRATLKDGRRVILKVQRPNLERTISTDLGILEWLAELAEERMPEVRRYSPAEAVKEFRKSLSKEIDFEREAYHMKRFARNFKDDPTIYVPKVYDEYTTARVLCEEYIDGIKVESKLIKEKAGLDRETVAKNGIRLIIEQVFVHGFFHADPHPGNIFIIEGNRICFIDYGMMGILDQERIDELLGFLVAVLTNNIDKLVRLFFKLGLIGEKTDVRGLRRDVDDLLHRYEAVEISKIDVGRYISQLFDVITRHEIILPADLLLMGKALATIDGVARDLYPELDPLGAIRPYVLKIYLRRLTDPAFFSREPVRIAEELYYLAQSGPRDLRIFLRHLREGTAKIQLEHLDLDDALKKYALATNRLALSVIMGSVILGSCYMLVSSSAGGDLHRFIGNFPMTAVLGLVGLGVCCFYGFVLFIGFLRSGGV
ncbi:AarF/ABC1/UbiB kinase family protein [bacterium]|nr:AarF/ABC1/UbiB kinase family protein [bacterium]